MDLKVQQNWLKFYDLYLQSGMTKVDFCRSQKIPQSKFFYYAKLHRKSAVLKLDKALAGPNLFIPLTARKDFTIKINGSVSLSFETVPDALWMANFVKAMGDAHARH
jgi:hypothetical protein